MSYFLWELEGWNKGGKTRWIRRERWVKRARYKERERNISKEVKREGWARREGQGERDTKKESEIGKEGETSKEGEMGKEGDTRRDGKVEREGSERSEGKDNWCSHLQLVSAEHGLDGGGSSGGTQQLLKQAKLVTLRGRGAGHDLLQIFLLAEENSSGFEQAQTYLLLTQEQHVDVFTCSKENSPLTFNLLTP
jgi:hypothetical protein